MRGCTSADERKWLLGACLCRGIVEHAVRCGVARQAITKANVSSVINTALSIMPYYANYTVEVSERLRSELEVLDFARFITVVSSMLPWRKGPMHRGWWYHWDRRKYYWISVAVDPSVGRCWVAVRRPCVSCLAIPQWVIVRMAQAFVRKYPPWLAACYRGLFVNGGLPHAARRAWCRLLGWQEVHVGHIADFWD